MARTFNRNPMSMPMPSKGDIQDYYFSHSEFKGLDNSKNYITTDPNTFADCKNVYVDLEGLLRSRPVIKNKPVLITTASSSVPVEINDILDVYTFGKITLYHTNKMLTMYNPDKETCIRMTLPDNNFKPILSEGKIFVFTSSKIMYFDIVKHSVYTTRNDSYIYTPITKLVTNGQESNFEPINELTTSHRIRYLFTDLDDNKDKYSILTGKTLTFTIDDVTYTKVFEESTKYTIVRKVNTPVTTDGSIVSMSDAGSIMFAFKNSDKYTIWYTHDGISYRSFYGRDDAVSVPSISADGKYVCCASTNNIYIAKIVDDGTGDLERWDVLSHDYQFAADGPITFTYSSSIKMLDKDNYTVIAKLDGRSRGICPVCIVCYNGVRRVYYFFDNTSLLSATSTDSKTIVISVDATNTDNYTYQTGLELSSFKWYTSSSTLLYSITPSWTLKCVLNNNSINAYVKGSTSYNVTTGGSTKECNLTMDVLLPNSSTNYIIIHGLKVFCTRKRNGNYIEFTITVEPYHNGANSEGGFSLIDLVYDHGYCFFDYLKATDTTGKFVLDAFNRMYPKIDMHLEGEKYYVALNYGDIFVINSDKGTVRHIDAPWNKYYDMQKYDVRITANSLYYTCPAYVTSTNAILRRTYTYKDGEYVHASDLYINTTGSSVLSEDGKVLTDNQLYVGASPTNLLFTSKPVGFVKNDIYLLDNKNTLYSSNKIQTVQFDETVPGTYTYVVPKHVSEIGNFYITVDKTLYISSYPSDGDFKWYFPKTNTEVFDQDVHGLHPTSATEMAVFLQDGVYNIQTSESGYLYYRTKLQVGIKNGAGIVTSYDGKYTIFPTYRGMVALTYQDFVATTEQVLTVLTDSILQTFKDYYSTDSIKLFKYDFWIICYKPGDNKYLVFDMRNNSWWPMELLYNVDKFVLINDEVVVLCNGKLYKFKHDDDNYYDDDSYVNEVEWHFTSQQLHLNAPNNYKHISSITLTSVLDSDVDLYFDLILYNYRKKLHKSDVDSFKFKVDTVRTYVKRLNYAKVGKFQYLLTSILNDAADDYEDVARTPLSISNITIKYKVSGQVR